MCAKICMGVEINNKALQFRDQKEMNDWIVCLSPLHLTKVHVGLKKSEIGYSIIDNLSTALFRTRKSHTHTQTLFINPFITGNFQTKPVTMSYNHYSITTTKVSLEFTTSLLCLCRIPCGSVGSSNLLKT